MPDPVQLAADFIRHEAVAVRVISSLGHRLSQFSLSSRFVRRDGMILEISPPSEGNQLVKAGDTLEFQLKLPHRAGSIHVNGSLSRFLPLAKDSDGKVMTVVAVKFGELTSETRVALETHELSVQAEQGIERSPRIPVRFPVELSGIDVMSPLFARDMSMTGMFISGRAKFASGKMLTLRFKLPFQDRDVSVKGKVVWNGEKRMVDQKDPCSGFGLQFVEPPAVARVAIATYYSRNTLTP